MTDRRLFTWLMGVGVAVVIVMGWWGEHLSMLAKENGPLETLSALFYLLGAGFCIEAIRRRRFVGAAMLWFVLCVLFFGEETSWLQHYLHYSVPTVERVNDQAEFNLHNLSAMRGDALVDRQGKVVWHVNVLTSPQMMFQLGMVAYFFLFPVMVRVFDMRRLRLGLGYPVVPPLFMLSLWSIIGVSVLMTVVSDTLTRHGLAETREMVYALYIALHTRSLVWGTGHPVRSSAPLARAMT